jgi:hypothetical protein
MAALEALWRKIKYRHVLTYVAKIDKKGEGRTADKRSPAKKSKSGKDEKTSSKKLGKKTESRETMNDSTNEITRPDKRKKRRKVKRRVADAAQLFAIQPNYIRGKMGVMGLKAELPKGKAGNSNKVRPEIK